MTPPNAQDERSRCHATTRSVAAWLERLDFHGIDPEGDAEPARAMRDELHANFYDGVSRWIVELRERLARVRADTGEAPEALANHLTEAMAGIIDAARDAHGAAAPDDEPGDEPDIEPDIESGEPTAPDPVEAETIEASAPPEPSEPDDDDPSDNPAALNERVLAFRRRLLAERARAAAERQEQRARSLQRLRKGREHAPAPDAPPAEAAPSKPTAPARPAPDDGIRFRRVDAATR
jgi:hypothetical protein